MDREIIDQHGYRLNVGLVMANRVGQLLWARRIGRVGAWQFPQGGMLQGETLRETLFRELHEELGLPAEAVEIIEEMPDWISYEIPLEFRRYGSTPLCVGQRQRWFLLRLIADDNAIQLDRSGSPEFDRWRWVDYWYPLKKVVPFKREVYKKVLKAFEGRF